MLSDKEVRQFYEDGFAVVKGVVAKEDLPRYREAYERMMEKVRVNPLPDYGTRFIRNEANLTAKARGMVSEDEVWGCNALLHPDLYEPEFTDYLTNQKLLSALSSILGNDMRVAGLKAIWSPKHVDYDLIWHRDGPDDVYTPDGSQAHIQFNTALNADASFRVVSGSHRRPLTDREKEASRKGVDPLPGEVVCELEPGDVLFMHSHTFHRGRASSASMRRTLHYIIARTDKPAVYSDLVKYRKWYEELDLDSKLEPTAKQLFANYFFWEGKVHPEDFPGKAAY